MVNAEVNALGGEYVNGQKLRDIRRKSGKTMRQISREADVTETQIYQIESGATKNPRIETLIGLAKALDCEIVDFLE